VVDVYLQAKRDGAAAAESSDRRLRPAAYE